MKFIVFHGAAAAMVLGAVIAANADDVAPVPGGPPIVVQCAKGFSYVAVSETNYECRTPFIKCPNGGEAYPLQWDGMPEGLRIRYSCALPPSGARQAFTCATGFFHGAIYPATYECRTRFINCPKRSSMLVFTEPLAWDTSSAGVRFKYRCRYQKPPA